MDTLAAMAAAVTEAMGAMVILTLLSEVNIQFKMGGKLSVR